MKLTMWLKERELNARRLAAEMAGEDRAGWLEDADHFQAALAAVEERGLLMRDADRYRWLRNNWARVITDTDWRGVDEPRAVKSIELGSATLGSVDGESLDVAIDRARETPNDKGKRTPEARSAVGGPLDPPVVPL